LNRLKRKRFEMKSPSEQKVERRALRPKEAAKAYGVGRVTLYEWMKSGRLASVKLGGARLIPVDALEALLSGHQSERR
jgi:excisionase family DNA binding protein